MSAERSSSDGFSARTLSFFDELEENNTREFWAANLATFESRVKAPMAELLESLPTAYQPFRVFRMNRDVRFSKDKAPYKTQHGAIHEANGTDHYVHVDAGGLLAACGIYWMEPEQLQRYRAAVDDKRSGAALQRALDHVSAQSVSVENLGLPPLKTAPRGYPKDHPRIELLRRKGVIAHRTLTGPPLADRPAVRDFVVETFEICQPLVSWLRRHVGSGPPT